MRYLVFYVFLLSLIGCETKEESSLETIIQEKGRPQSTNAYMPDGYIEVAEYDTVQVGQYQLLFEPISAEEYEQSPSWESMDVKKNIRQIAKENIVPLLKWETKLSTFLQLEKALQEVDDRYKLGLFDALEALDDEVDGEFEDIIEEGKSGMDRSHEGIGRSLEMVWFALEEFDVLKEDYFDRTNDSTLLLLLQNRKSTSLIDHIVEEADTVRYNFITVLPTIDHYLIEEQSKRGANSILVNRKTGKAVSVWGMPNIIEHSLQKGSRLIVIQNDVELMKENGIQILSLSSKKDLDLLLEIQIANWAPEGARFVDNVTVVIQQNTLMVPACPEYEYTKMTIRKEAE